MLTILQNATGSVCEAQLAATLARHRAYCAVFGYGMRVTHHRAPAGLAGMWSKLPAWLAWELGAADGDAAVGLDTDAVIVARESLAVLPADADLGMVRAGFLGRRWWNSGVVFMRKRGDVLRRFFEAVLRRGPVAGHGLAGEQPAMNELIASGACAARVAVIAARFNSYRYARSAAPVIRAFHGERDKAAVLEKLKAEVGSA